MDHSHTDMAVWSSLTWDDIEAWAGSRSTARGKAYQRQERVRDLAVTEDGHLLATVVGTQRYTVTVWLEQHSGDEATLCSRCNCPVGDDGCKHAVATVAALIEVMAVDGDVPVADPDDPRWDLIADNPKDTEPDDYFDEQTHDANKAGKDKQRRTDWDRKIREHLQGYTADALVGLIDSLMPDNPKLRNALRERVVLSDTDTGRLAAQARRELHKMTSIDPWRDHWSGEGEIPDYSRLKRFLERLVEVGRADDVVTLGRSLLRLGIEQVGRSDDEGETASSLSECLPIVFDAVACSSMSAPDQLLYAIDALLQDDYDLIGDAAGELFEANRSPEAWSVVADTLASRLEQIGKPSKRGSDAGDSFTRFYQRDRISDWLLNALAHAGREDELLPIYETEAKATGSYERLVDFLVEQGRDEEAQRWAREGIEVTHKQYPGIVTGLVNSMRELARSRKQWPTVASYDAWAFFAQPCVETFTALCDSAGKAKCRKPVRLAALRFLETGVCPIRVKESGKKGRPVIQTGHDWPLPVPEDLAPIICEPAPPEKPHYDVLLDLAILDKRPDDVLRWYDRLCDAAQKHPGGWHWRGHGYADRVAAAVAKSHPDRALAIYEHALEAHLKEASMSAYEAVGSYLRKMRPILEALGRASEWAQRIAQLREQYRRRPRFMEVLDKLEERTILQSSKSRKKR